ncbi:mechanosensitive ion channel domain-containing protein [Francisella salimarina]|uniref:mechanosensitive ion channel domain-containing protein n=1 Tax=Francisella salimarina TaxID=2599927 RepID=UPI003D8199B2
MILNNELFLNTIDTAIMAIFITIIATVVFHILKKRKTSEKQISKLKSRTIYISIIIFSLIIIKIWLGGITNLLTMLSLVAAGLIIVNKETVMNLVGWIIINWRSLFSEGDYIQIMGYHGCVTEIKLFYFRMYETIEHGDKKTTGKLLKFPNSIIITNVISTFTSEENISLNKIPFLISTDSDILKIRDSLNLTIRAIISEKYSFNETFTQSDLVTKHKLRQYGINDFAPYIEIKTLSDKTDTLNIQAYFYCFSDDKKEIEQLYLNELVKIIKLNTSF